MDKLNVRRLGADEFHRLKGVGPLPTDKFPSPDTSEILVAEDSDGEIRAFWGAFTTVHVEPVWIDPAYRNRPGLVHQLFKGIYDVLLDHKVEVAYATISEEDYQTSLPLAMKLGFQRVPGILLFVNLSDWKKKRGD